MPDDATIFDAILAGTIPCHRVYEDENVLAFLDIGPLAEGHTLVIPKERGASLRNLSPDAAAALGRVLPAIARAVTEATGADGCNILINDGEAAGQEVMHVHAHIIPRTATTGLRVTWTAGSLDGDRGAELAARVAARITAG